MGVSDLKPRQLTEGRWTFGEFNPKSIITDAELDRLREPSCRCFELESFGWLSDRGCRRPSLAGRIEVEALEGARIWFGREGC